ncbi:MAG: tRNA (adenosine(37)-N6)-threonylcarbamoyltransferase complex dimerization subunit type 1 TsaB [Firmicutes bacterium]|nr:tRNA (adenosine(37)-N6)-threonylcarbamoyltransferase complex dimerization subunit type 1 TsaB [Bacillota bacterium]
MYILAIETTGPQASAALINHKGQVWEEISERTLSHLQNLIPMVDTLLRKCGLKINDIDGIAVSEGPGSFTGIRIGVSTARALAQTSGKPLMGIPTLRAFAFNLADCQDLICPIFDARRDQVYSGIYHWEGTKLVQDLEDGAYDVPEFAQKAADICRRSGKSLMLFGDGIKKYGHLFEGAKSAPEELQLQRASSAAKLARTLWDPENLRPFQEVKPVYLRQAEAQRKLEERLAMEAEKND